MRERSRIFLNWKSGSPIRGPSLRPTVPVLTFSSISAGSSVAVGKPSGANNTLLSAW